MGMQTATGAIGGVRVNSGQVSVEDAPRVAANIPTDVRVEAVQVDAPRVAVNMPTDVRLEVMKADASWVVPAMPEDIMQAVVLPEVTECTAIQATIREKPMLLRC